MLLALAALVLGGIVGLVAGGRPRNVTQWPLRAWALLVAGCVLQVVASRVGLGEIGTALLIVGYGCLIAFCLANWVLSGMGIAAFGLLANAVVISFNGGMPVRTSTLVATRMVTPAQVATLRFDARHHPEGPDTRLAFLGDIIPITPLNELVSFGDLILAVGAADVAVHVLRPRRGRHRGATGAGGAVTAVRASGASGAEAMPGGSRRGRLGRWLPTPQALTTPRPTTGRPQPTARTPAPNGRRRSPSSRSD